MKKYYLRRNDEEKGPCTITELRQSGLHPTDMIWNGEWEEWKLVIDTDEFKEHFLLPGKQTETDTKIVSRQPGLIDRIKDIIDRKSKYFTLLVWSLVILILLLIYYFLNQLF